MTPNQIARERGQVKGAGGRSAQLVTEQLKWAIKQALGTDRREYSIGSGDGTVVLRRRTGYNP